MASLSLDLWCFNVSFDSLVEMGFHLQILLLFSVQCFFDTKFLQFKISACKFDTIINSDENEKYLALLTIEVTSYSLVMIFVLENLQLYQLT